MGARERLAASTRGSWSSSCSIYPAAPIAFWVSQSSAPKSCCCCSTATDTSRAADTSSSFIRDICLHRPCKTGRLKLHLVPWHLLARIISRCSVWVYPEGQAEAGAELPACYSFLLCCSKWSNIMSISWRRGRPCVSQIGFLRQSQTLDSGAGKR